MNATLILESLPKHQKTIQPSEIQELTGDGPLIVEIGCHDGSDTERFLKEIPHSLMVCFEPDPRPVARFKERIGNHYRVRLYETAVADVDGMKDFHASTGEAGRRKDWDYSGSLCEPTGHLTRSPEIGFKPPAPVLSKRLDTWWKDNGKRVVDFIWADVQGSQRLVIDGGRKTLAHTRYFYIEAHDPVAYAGEPTQTELIELLSEWFVPVAIYAKENILFKRRGKQ